MNAEKPDHLLADDDFKLDDGSPNTDAIHRSFELHYMLVNLCEGTSASIIRQAHTLHGLEIWRRLHEHYRPEAATSAVGRLDSILEFHFTTDNFENDFVKWEAEIQKFEKETSSVLADIVKVALLMNKTNSETCQT